MLFNSYTFVLFFAVVLGLHYLPLPWRVKKFNLLIGSYLFYAAWNPPFVALLWLSTVVDWFAAKWMDRVSGKTMRRLALFVSLSVNLGLLAYFKYGGFLLENFIALAQSMGVTYRPAEFSVVLPVGSPSIRFRRCRIPSTFTAAIQSRGNRFWTLRCLSHSFRSWWQDRLFAPLIFSHSAQRRAAQPGGNSPGA